MKEKRSRKRKRESEAEARKDLVIDWDAFIRYYNTVLRRYGSAIEPLKRVSRGYRARIQAMVNEEGSKDFLGQAITNMAKADCLNGRKPIHGKPFLGSFTWLFSKVEVFDKVCDGYYNDAPELEPTAEELRRQQQEQRELEREQQREEARRIEEEEAEARRRQREYDRAHAAKGEELQRILADVNKTFELFNPNRSLENHQYIPI